MKTMIAFGVVSFFLFFSPVPALANADEVATNEGGSVEFIECAPLAEATAPFQVAQARICPANADGSCVSEKSACTKQGPQTFKSPRCTTQTLPTGQLSCRCSARPGA